MENQNISKKEQYLLRKQEKEKEHQGRIRQKKIKKILSIVLPLILVIGGTGWWLTNYSPGGESATTPGVPKIEINPEEYDAGTVSMAAGLVKKTYEIKNIGEGDLKIDRIRTSCDCTTARLKVGDKESPEFGMHDSSSFWSQKIAPAETGFLEVIFDPAFHGPMGTGLVVRAIYLSTNDPQNKTAEVRLTADVVQ